MRAVFSGPTGTGIGDPVNQAMKTGTRKKNQKRISTSGTARIRLI